MNNNLITLVAILVALVVEGFLMGSIMLMAVTLPSNIRSAA